MLEHNNETVEWFDDFIRQLGHEPKEIAVWVSGGTDSAFTLWYLSKCISESPYCNFVKILPVHGFNTAGEDSVTAAVSIVKYVQEEFSNLEIYDTHIFNYSLTDYINENKGTYHNRAMSKLKSEGWHYFITGMTANPPYDVMKENNMLDDREPDRDKDYNTKGKKTEYQHRPFQFVDKSFIAAMYKKYNLEELFTFTSSCVNFNPPCKRCWWCKEKKWAFGYYDGVVR